MNSFVNAIENEASLNGVKKYTENGAVARSSTGSALIDFYSACGSMRDRSEADIISKFHAAWNENPLYALKTVFYSRDIRGGRGERRLARVILKHLASNHGETVVKNFDNLMEMGRADDFYVFVGTPIENQMWAYLKSVILDDLKNMKAKKPISITAKWLKSENTSSQESRILARKTAKAFGLTGREYRKMLVRLRNYLKVVEVKMSANEWKSIDYSTVPAKAMSRYKEAFKKHCPEAFETYVTKVEKGEAKINASTLFPYELVKKYCNTQYWGFRPKDSEDRVVEAQWKALPNYLEGENNVLVMADVSGSMYGDPICSSIGLAIYFAEHNKGAFKNLYMTFTDRPHYIQINENQSLLQKINAVYKTDIGYSTNLEAAFMKVLSTCVENHIPQSDVPKAIVVLSDMEINPYFSGRGLDFITEMANRFEANGYHMPKLVMWNLAARNDTFHASYKNPYVQFACGQSAAEFGKVMATLGYNAYDAMIKTLDSPRYAKVVL